MNAASLEKRLALCESLPVLPLALQNVQRLMRDQKSSMSQIAEVIATDQALASKTIKLVNSAFYGMTRPISSITQAIVILGLNTLSHLMLGLSVTKMFDSGDTTFDSEAFWRHAFGVALIAQGVAEAVRYEQPDECFIGGLIHDIGRLVLQHSFHDDCMKAIALARRKHCSLLEAETAVLGADHTYAGGFLADTWKIPPVFIAAIKYHHCIQCIPSEFRDYAQVVGIVAASNVIVGNEKIGDSGERIFAPQLAAFTNGIPADVVQKIIARAKSTIASTIQQWQTAS